MQSHFWPWRYCLLWNGSTLISFLCFRLFSTSFFLAHCIPRCGKLLKKISIFIRGIVYRYVSEEDTDFLFLKINLFEEYKTSSWILVTVSDMIKRDITIHLVTHHLLAPFPLKLLVSTVQNGKKKIKSYQIERKFSAFVCFKSTTIWKNLSQSKQTHSKNIW